MSDATVQPGCEAWHSDGDGARGRVGVVVTHGFTGNPRTTRPLGERLAAEGFTVAVPRLPGHGTTAKDMARTRYADWLAAVEREHDLLADRCDAVVLVGLSMGGTLSLDVATRRDVAGVVPINAAILDRDGLLAKLAPVLKHLAPMVPAKAAGLVEDDIARPGVSEGAYDTVSTKAGHSLTRALPRIRAALPSLTAPVLVCVSPEDHSVPAENSLSLPSMLPNAASVRVLRLENSFHIATLDLDQQLLEDEVVAFIDEVTA